MLFVDALLEVALAVFAGGLLQPCEPEEQLVVFLAELDNLESIPFAELDAFALELVAFALELVAFAFELVAFAPLEEVDFVLVAPFDP